MLIKKIIFVTFAGTVREARILISIVVVFIFCQSFKIVADAYEAFTCSYENMRRSNCGTNQIIESIIDLSHFLLALNSSINFVLYVIHEETFRKTVLKVLMKLLFVFDKHYITSK